MKKIFCLTLMLLFTVACERATATPTPTLIMSLEASAYLEEALTIIQENSYYSNQVDWEEVRPRVSSFVAGAQFPDETYRAIQAAINSLYDDWAQLYTPGQMVNIGQYSGDIVNPPPPEGKLVADRLGYLSVPPSFGDDVADLSAYVDLLQQTIQSVDAALPCGWIVDLQGSSGGVIWSMLAGIGPILGDGPAGASVDQNGILSEWSYADGQAIFDGELMIQSTIPPYHLQQELSPVAVLTSSETLTGGEALAVSFKNRPDTRSFGERTSGYAAWRTCLPLDDGAVVCVTSHLFADRTGLVYDMAIDPDETIVMTGEIPQAAIDWLLAQPACNTP